MERKVNMKYREAKLRLDMKHKLNFMNPLINIPLESNISDLPNKYSKKT